MVVDGAALTLGVVRNIWEEVGRGVGVQAGEAVARGAGERSRVTTGFPKNNEPRAKNTSTVETASSCHPAIILACRVR